MLTGVMGFEKIRNDTMPLGTEEWTVQLSLDELPGELAP